MTALANLLGDERVLFALGVHCSQNCYGCHGKNFRSWKLSDWSMTWIVLSSKKFSMTFAYEKPIHSRFVSAGGADSWPATRHKTARVRQDWPKSRRSSATAHH